jgi:hemolysin activation/secretion protein
VRPGLFVGGNFDVNHTIATDEGPRMTGDSTYQAQGSSIFNTGIGAVLQYDTRDVAGNAWRGTYAALSITKYGRTLGGNGNYATYLWDYRHYRPLGRNGRTLAFQLKARLTGGTVPWPELSMVGSGSDVRGYVEGRFRDREVLIGLLEYRHMFVRSSGQLSRHGFVTWVGGGAMGPSLEFEGFLPNAGVGYRFELQPRANVRVDVGFGHRSRGVYFNFNEAF